MASRVSSKTKLKRTVKTNSSEKTSEKSEDDFDTAVLNKPFESSVNNIPKLIKLYQSTTEEIQNILVYECDVLYECRICRSIFRSLSNFIFHKRLYCQEKYDVEHHIKWPQQNDTFLDVIQEDANPISNNNKDVKTAKKNINSVIEGLTQKKQFGFEIKNFDIDEFYKQNENCFEGLTTRTTNKLELEQISDSNNAVFQTLKLENESMSKLDSMKLETMEIQMLTEGQTVVLGPDGKAMNIPLKTSTEVSSEKDVSSDNNGSTDLNCKKCNISFATRKTFLFHLKYKHDNTRLVYPCVECSDTFATLWGLYRHLYNIHRKTMSEVRKMRSKIQARTYRRDEEDEKGVNSKNNHNAQKDVEDLNQEWMNNFETDNDIQMCGGCGRRFERKAALNSHSQTCQKRIALKNSINANKQKRTAAVEEKVTEKKNTKINKSEADIEKQNSNDSQNPNKKRKIGIQIRCNYNKNVEKPKTFPTSVLNSSRRNSTTNNLQSNNDIKPFIEVNNKTPTPEQLVSYLNNSILHHHRKEAELLQDAEVVSIPSSNSSPSKEEQDPLAIKESDSDLEIEEIIGPIPNNILCSESFTEAEEFADNTNNINEDALKLIKLINSDMTIESTRPTLDQKMEKYVDLKKILCIPCNLKFSNISKLRYHMATHFNWWRFKCDICSFKAYDKIDVIEHIKESHNIQELEKIESVTFQIWDWETIELSSSEFLFQENLVNSDGIKEEIPITCTPDIDNCFIVESMSEQKSNSLDDIKTKPSRKVTNVKRKVKKTDDNETNSQLPLNDTNETNVNDQLESSGSLSSDAAGSNSQDLKKMVYEVIFGDVTVGNSSKSNSSNSSEDKNNIHVVQATDVSNVNVISRPVRNRIKHIDKDFIYDLNEYKEKQKTNC